MKRAVTVILCVLAILPFTGSFCFAQTGGELPELVNSSGGVLIERLSASKQWMSDFLIISKEGTVVIMDAYQTPNGIIEKIKPAIITVSHTQHDEHHDPALIGKFKDDPAVAISIQKPETFVWKGIEVRGVASAHSIYGVVLPLSPANVIYSVETDGIKIVHFGGLGQKELEADQVAALGRVDVALVPFGQYKNEIVNILLQVKPKVIIVTHRMASVSLEETAKTLGTSLEKVRNKLVLDPASVMNGGLRMIDLTNELY
jgi:L-ascorbate metabolism protein UlaG (beta-lactamase superfamily)